MLVLVFLLFNSFLLGCLAAPPAEHNSRTFRNALNQQSLQTILQSIEERLRNLDHIYSIRYVNINTDQYIRKIEVLESKLSRFESKIEGQLEKLSENMSTKNFKDDISKDQLFRKMDSVYERMNHKISYLEGKIEMDVLKLQTKIEAGISKIERLDHSFSVRQADMEAEVSEAVEMMDTVKNNVAAIENKLMNVTKNTIENTVEKQTNLVENKFDNVTNLIAQIDLKINKSLEQCSQNDFVNDSTNKDEHLTKTIKQYEDQIQNYENKVTNMYNELWKKSTNIENTIKNSILLMNLTHTEIQDFKKSGNKLSTENSQNDGQMEIIIDSFTNTIHQKFSLMGRKMDSNFENVILAQNLFLESCRRLQIEEDQMETKIGLVLEKLLDVVTNKSIITFREIQSMEELIKSHDSNFQRTLSQNTNTIIKLSEKTTDDRKRIEKNLFTFKRDIGSALEIIQNEVGLEFQENSRKFDTIAGIVLELQEQVNDLDSRVNEDNINYNAKQILQDILLVTKTLANKDIVGVRLNTTMEDLTTLMRGIYHVLTSIDMKINNGAQHENVTKENGKIFDEVTEPEDFVLEIFPEGKNETTKNSVLGRFNYTLINKDVLLNYDEDINEYIPVAQKDHGIVINGKNNSDILEIINKFDEETTKNNNYDERILETNKDYLSSTVKRDSKNLTSNNKNNNSDIPEVSTVTPPEIPEVEITIENNSSTIDNRENINSIIIKTDFDIPEASTVINTFTTSSATENKNDFPAFNKKENIEKGFEITTTRSNYNLQIMNINYDVPEASTIVNKNKYDVPKNTIVVDKNNYGVPEASTVVNKNNYEIPGALKVNKNSYFSTTTDKEIIKIDSLPIQTNDNPKIMKTNYNNLDATLPIINENDFTIDKNENIKIDSKKSTIPKIVIDDKKYTVPIFLSEITSAKISQSNKNIIRSNYQETNNATLTNENIKIDSNTQATPTNDDSGNFFDFSILTPAISNKNNNEKNIKLNSDKDGNNNGIIINGLAGNYLISNQNKQDTQTIKNITDKADNASIEKPTAENKNIFDQNNITDTLHSNNDTIINHSKTSLQNEKSIFIKDYINPVSKHKNKNETNVIVNRHIMVTEDKNNTLESTITDVLVSDSTMKTIKIESEHNLESVTQVQNSFEYTDLKNNTNDEHVRDEYEWEYED